MVNQHPQPVDDCPCFEDAIAFVSVVLGSLLARWHATQYGFDEQFFRSVMPGSAGQTWADVGVWFVFATMKMVVGQRSVYSLQRAIAHKSIWNIHHRYHGDILLAHSGKIDATHDPSSDLSIAGSCIHTSQSTVLYACDRLRERSQ